MASNMLSLPLLAEDTIVPFDLSTSQCLAVCLI